LNAFMIHTYVNKVAQLAGSWQSSKTIRIPANVHSHTIEIFRINAVEKNYNKKESIWKPTKHEKLATRCEKRYKCTCGCHLQSSKGSPLPTYQLFCVLLCPPFSWCITLVSGACVHHDTSMYFTSASGSHVEHPDKCT